jgi:hypothetical protein
MADIPLNADIPFHNADIPFVNNINPNINDVNNGNPVPPPLPAMGQPLPQHQVPLGTGQTVLMPVKLSKYLNKPKEYDGKDRNACTTFLAQVRLYLSGSPQEFASDEAKVMFVTSYLRDRAFAWIEPKLLNDDPILHNFELFADELLRNLGDPEREKTMSKKLRALRQTSSAAAYRTEFDAISQYLTWDQSALKQYYYEGLKDSVKDSLALSDLDPPLLKDFQDLTIRLDNRLFERKQESKHGRPSLPKFTKTTTNNNRSHGSAPKPAVTVNTYGAPMDLDGTKNKKFKPLTPQERAFRMANRLCLYCGKEGHRANDCPVKKRPGSISAVITGPMDKSSKSPGKQSEN